MLLPSLFTWSSESSSFTSRSLVNINKVTNAKSKTHPHTRSHLFPNIHILPLLHIECSQPIKACKWHWHWQTLGIGSLGKYRTTNLFLGTDNWKRDAECFMLLSCLGLVILPPPCSYQIISRMPSIPWHPWPLTPSDVIPNKLMSRNLGVLGTC